MEWLAGGLQLVKAFCVLQIIHMPHIEHFQFISQAGLEADNRVTATDFLYDYLF
jgi:hypothetical protein